VSNLLVNAARHGAPPIRVSASAGDSELVIVIEDRGRGVEPEFANSLFERFTRGATSSSEGAGLGLAIARSYAQAHGRSLTYAPPGRPGAWSTLTLPIQPSPVCPPSDGRLGPAPGRGAPRRARAGPPPRRRRPPPASRRAAQRPCPTRTLPGR